MRSILSRYLKELDRIFETSLEPISNLIDMVVKEGEKPGETILSFDIPGVEKGDIKIRTTGNKLYVEATRKDREPHSTKRFSYRSEVGEIKVKKATLKNGVLTLVIEEGPVAEEVQIEIE